MSVTMTRTYNARVFMSGRAPTHSGSKFWKVAAAGRFETLASDPSLLTQRVLSLRLCDDLRFELSGAPRSTSEGAW